MALVLTTLTLENGISIDESYARIDTVNGYKGEITISFNYYLSQQSFTEGIGYIKQEYHSFVPSVADDAPNFIKQGYEYLKSLAEFQGAIDA